MRISTRMLSFLVAVVVLLPATAQQPMDPPDPTPPPLPPRPQKGKPLKSDDKITPEQDKPWGLPEEMLEKLAQKVEIYREFAVRFTCDETARVAGYDGFGQANSEELRRYAYLVVRDDSGETIREYRQRLDREGRPRGASVKDEEPFPPAYAWVFLFSRFNQPYFAYRDLGDRFEGFDWVREIQFRGVLGFTDGKDIRQWEGTVLVDATTLTPLEIRAQPSRQDERIVALYKRWARSFNLIGFRLGPRPMAYRSRVQFRLRQKGLTFPTEVRYDTLRATGPSRARPVRASTRVYDRYRFFETRAKEEFDVPATN